MVNFRIYVSLMKFIIYYDVESSILTVFMFGWPIKNEKGIFKAFNTMKIGQFLSGVISFFSIDYVCIWIYTHKYYLYIYMYECIS